MTREGRLVWATMTGCGARRPRDAERPYTVGVWIRRDVLEFIVAHARRDAPRECCGLLVGDHEEVTEAVAVTNIAEAPLRQYEVSPTEHLALIKRCRDQSSTGPCREVIGAYHSHPCTEARPSPTDLDRACRDFLVVIAGPVSEARDIPVRGFRLAGDQCHEVRLAIVE